MKLIGYRLIAQYFMSLMNLRKTRYLNVILNQISRQQKGAPITNSTIQVTSILLHIFHWRKRRAFQEDCIPRKKGKYENYVVYGLRTQTISYAIRSFLRTTC